MVDGSPIPSGVFTRERLRRDLDRLEKAKRANPDCPIGHLSCPIPGRIGTEVCFDPKLADAGAELSTVH